MEEGDSIDENKIIDIYKYQSINNNLHGLCEVSHECKCAGLYLKVLKSVMNILGIHLLLYFYFII